MRDELRTRVLAAVLLLLTQLHCATPPSSAVQTPAASPAQLVDEAAAIIERESLDVSRVDWSAVRGAAPRDVATVEEAHAAIRGMLAKLGAPAERLLSASQAAALMAEVGGGESVGVGLPELLSVDVDEKTHLLTVVTPLPDSPAARAGLRPRDVIEAIEGRPTRGLWLEEAADLMRGQAGTRLTLTIRRGEEVFPVTLTRESRQRWTRPVRWKVEQVQQGRALGLIGFDLFYAGVGAEVREAVKQLQEAGVEGLVLDLRGNGGGQVQESVEVASLFLGDAPLGRLVGPKEPAMELRAEGATASVRWPLVVLVDEGTASAAELLAGALEAQGRAVLLGARTFGKGRVHAPFPLKDGSVLLLTVARVRTPSGRDILDEALEPSVRVSSKGTSGEDAAWQRALEWLADKR
ncbi:S41 family peptidase [Hyalangium sp.]|uniref:S41 family peptidase n=1 Tax=Hyalangium sp. TaxID=2028555 RepID=UPI002D76009A|nr:S41 family peptidase [Hyalangium sp.]HYH96623.1 S41 family peptidase [Hyalangium sp.]